MKINPKEFLWVEKYRPQKIEDCILPKLYKKQFLDIVAHGKMPNMLLSGTAGVGKTTVAIALCNEMGLDWIKINGSDDNGVNVIRDTIKTFASTVSLMGTSKVVIIDEGDYLTGNAQAILRGTIEAFSATCTFVITCNYPNRIIDALHSRLQHTEFKVEESEKAELQMALFARICAMLDNEKVTYDKKVLITIINKYYPDNRKVIGILDQYSKGGAIDNGVLLTLQDVTIESLIKAMKDKSFKDIRQWCSDNKNNDISSLYSKLYKSLKDFILPESIPEAILILEDYQRYDAIVPDKELHLAAMSLQLGLTLSFK